MKKPLRLDFPFLHFHQMLQAGVNQPQDYKRLALNYYNKLNLRSPKSDLDFILIFLNKIKILAREAPLHAQAFTLTLAIYCRLKTSLAPLINRHHVVEWFHR
jgi:hypothetical protein